MKLLEVLPDVAKLSQIRFAANFQQILACAHNFDVLCPVYLIHIKLETRVDYLITADLRRVIEIVSKYGNDCQVIKIENSGAVESLN